ncbi:hypothetical protein BV898_07702 [Hypsibius exemplaris]|uniref:Prefoldin subunit 4 n=1 Tax=Hypsibius exemplaris TaxID=2072580 RepID=A0A1W0WSX9_HYPEX|nr:hypothetical protein BV898_07702 [Hypsibius exemplaris]
MAATSTTILPVEPAKKDSVAVSKDVHAQIGRFAILHSLSQENAAHLKLAKKELQDITDAEDELLLVDDDVLVPCQVDLVAVFEKSKDDASAFLEEEKSRIQTQIDRLTKQAADYGEELTELRSVLYGKLGNAVQLEGTDEDSD